MRARDSRKGLSFGDVAKFRAKSVVGTSGYLATECVTGPEDRVTREFLEKKHFTGTKPEKSPYIRCQTKICGERLS